MRFMKPATAVGAAAIMAVCAIAPARAAPVLSNTAAVRSALDSSITDVRWGGGWGGGWGWGGGALAAGLIGGLALGALATAPYGYGGYGYGYPAYGYGYPAYGYGYAPSYGYSYGYAPRRYARAFVGRRYYARHARAFVGRRYYAHR